MPLALALLATGATIDPTSLIPPILLLGIALFAAVYLFFTRSTKQPIFLPTTDDHAPPSAQDDPLDIDVEIDPEGFYPRLRLKKLALFASLLLLEGLALFQLTWDAIRGVDWTEAAIVVVFWVSSSHTGRLRARICRLCDWC